MKKRLARFVVLLLFVFHTYLCLIAQPRTDRTLWTEPTDLKSSNLLYGPEGPYGVPDENTQYEPITDLHHNKLLRDTTGRLWEIRAGRSAQAETAAQRILWAAGYASLQQHFAHTVFVRGESTQHDVVLKRANGSSAAERTWSWKSNPFTGTRELEGLITLLILVNDWDVQDRDTTVIGDSPSKKETFGLSHLRVAFGKLGEHSSGNAKQYAKGKFIYGVKDGYVQFYDKSKNIPSRVRTSSAKWVGMILSKLSREQFTDAFKAGGFSETETVAFVDALLVRVAALKNLESN
jgi:hypothetical protein